MLGHELIFSVQLEILLYRYEDLKGKMKEQGGEDAWFLSYVLKKLQKEQSSCANVHLQKCSFPEYDSFKQISYF